MKPWSVPRCFVGRTVAVLASGPSMSRSVADRVRLAGVPAIAVNNTHKLAPWAWMLYAADAAWWEHESNRDAKAFDGILASVESVSGVRQLQRTGSSGFDPDPHAVRTGSNSGYQAIHIAAHTGAARVLMLGFDFRNVDGERHWHGNHAPGLRNTEPEHFVMWAPRFASLRDGLAARGCELINCTPGSGIGCVPFMDLETALASRPELAAA